ncbi:MAG: Yip1 family protein [Vicinamibacterales bacterium]
MGFVDRVRNICVSPATEWLVIEPENTSRSELVVSYLAPLAAAGAAAGFIGSALLTSVLPISTGGAAIPIAIVMACLSFALTIAGCFIIGLIINALAPTFGGRQDSNQAFKLSVYAYTPALVAGVLAIIPLVGALFGFVGWIYSLYLTYLGLTPMMKSPPEKAPAYTIVVVVCSVVLGVTIALITTLVAGLGFLGARAL